MFKIKGMRSWNTNADNLNDMVRFYCDVLGAEERVRHTVRDADVVRVALGNSVVGLFDFSNGPVSGVPHHTMEFEGPSDPNEMIKELEARGVKVQGMRPHGEGEGRGYSVYVDDPNGNHIELSTDPA